MRHLAVVALAAGCSQKIYSPPSQLYAVTPIAALPAGAQAVDLDFSRHAQIFDPELDVGSGRLRFGTGDNTEVSVEGNAAALRQGGPSMERRTFYTGRAGVRTNPGRSSFTFFAGAGGGIADAGSFVSADVGFGIGYQNCVLVPTVQVAGYISEPIDARPVDVTVDSKEPTFDTPHTTLGAATRFGARLSLSPSSCRRGEPTPWVVAGIGVTSMMDVDSDAAIPGVGIGLEVPLY